MKTEPVKDSYQRPLQDLRVSVTDRCNLRCTYCMPEELFPDDFAFLNREQILSFEELLFFIERFVELGVKKIRITGGEPLVRKNIETFIKDVVAIPGLEDIGLTTNGVLLASKAKKLKQAGLQRVNVSLDAINQRTLQRLNGRKIEVTRIIEGIFAARREGLEVKVNMVVIRGRNEDQVLPMAEFFKKQNITLRFIEYMDVGCSNKWNLSQVITKKQIYDQIQSLHQLEPVDPHYFGEVASRYRYVGSDAEVGFISSVSETFCSSCTRGRISADGKFFTCLFAENGFDLKALLRNSATNQEVRETIQQIWHDRTDRYSEERSLLSKVPKRHKIEMSYIGG